MPALKKLSSALRSALARSNPPNAEHKVPGTLAVRAAADGTDAVELLIYGNIGSSWWDDTVTAKSVVEQLSGITAKTINVRINSYGGSCSDGAAIYNELRRQSANGVTVNVSIDGTAASIASLIAMAGDTITMPANALMMLHAPWGSLYVDGNAKVIREVSAEFADLLDVYGKAMATSYARKTGKPASEFEAMWDGGKDHWYTAADALAFGLVDTVVDDADLEDDEDDEDDDDANAALRRLVASAPPELAHQIRATLRTPNNPSAPAPATPHSPAAAGVSPPAQPGKTKEKDMPNANNTPAADVQAAATKAAADAVASLQNRNTEIRALAAPHCGNAEVKAYVDKVVDDANPEVTAADVGKQILALLAKGAGPLNGNAVVIPGADQRDKTREAMAAAIEARSGLSAKADPKLADNPFRGHSMSELARACVVAAGVNTNGMDKREIVGAAFTHSTSDFPGLLGDSARKAALKGYEEAEEVIEEFTRAISVPDFKPTSLAGLGAFSDLLVVPEGSEYKYGTFSEQSQAMRLVTFGRLFSITRQAIINDDLSVFTEVPRKMGQAAKRTIASAVFKLLTDNPLLADGFALFSAEHGNLLTGAAISTTSVDAMRQSFALQKDADNNTIRVPLKTLLAPVALGGLARTVKTSQFEVSGAKNLTTPNIVQNTFEVVDDGRLDAANAASWYGIANPAVVDGIVVGYLDGNQTPYLEEEQGFTVDGVTYKVRLDAAPAIADYRGLRKNPGA